MDALTLNEVGTEVPDISSTASSGDTTVSRNNDEIWTVESGDSFWTIAEETLSDVWGRSDLTEEEIADYWRVLIDANEDRLVDAGNPDLILPGQVLILPPVVG